MGRRKLSWWASTRPQGTPLCRKCKGTGMNRAWTKICDACRGWGY
jgi:DnaJ-class molecular chaperone